METGKKNRIILYTPKPTREGRRLLPINLLAISSYLDKEGYKTEIYYSNDYNEWSKAIKNLEDVICIGISSMTGYQIIDGLKFAKKVKEINKNIPIIWGGIHPTVKPKQTVKNPLVDIVIRGQGEVTFYELVKTLNRGGNLGSVLGLTYKKGDKIIENQSRPVSNINDLPPLPYRLLDDKIERYIKPGLDAKRILPIITSDGCPFKCSFCYMSMPEFSRQYIAMSAGRVVEQIELLVNKYKLDGIRIGDSNFFIDVNRARNIFKGLVGKNINISLLAVNVRADQLLRLNDEDWRLMEKAGVKELLIGAESGDQEMLDLINKRITVKDIIDCQIQAANYNINIVNSFITGYPPTSDNIEEQKQIMKRELYNTVNLINKIIEINPLSVNMIFFYTPYPGTPLYKLCLKHDFKEPKSLEEWGEIDLSQKNTPWISDEHIKKTRYFEKLFLIKKITSKEYIHKKLKQNNRKFRVLYSIGLLKILNYIASLRIKYKIFILPFENIFIKE